MLRERQTDPRPSNGAVRSADPLHEGSGRAESDAQPSRSPGVLFYAFWRAVATLSASDQW